jgi:1,4-alpha-glucan branching enzyme
VNDANNSVLGYVRKGNDHEEMILFAANLTPVPRPDYRFGVPMKGKWKEILNSDDLRDHGTGNNLNGEKNSEDYGEDGRDQSIVINVPPLGAVFMKFVNPSAKKKAKS